VGTETTVFDRNAFPLYRIGESLENRDGIPGWRCRRERRTTPFAHVGEERELGDDKDRSVDIDNTSVHLSRLIREDAHADRLRRGDARIDLGVARSNSHEGEETGTDLTGHLLFDFDCGSADSLQDDAHRTFLVGSECTVHR